MTGLRDEEVAAYWERGFVHAPSIFSAAEVDDLRAECERLAAENAARLSTIAEAFPRRDRAGHFVPNLIDPVVARSRIVRELLRKPSIVGALRAIFQDEPHLFKDKLILRPPGSGGYGLHQDFAYWGWTGAPADWLAAVQIAIDDAGEGNGAVQFHPGMHHQLLPAAAHGGNDIHGDLMGSARAELVATRAGDAIFFHPLTPHWSDLNRSGSFRRTLYLTYNAASAGDLYRVYYQERGAVLPRDSERA